VVIGKLNSNGKFKIKLPKNLAEKLKTKVGTVKNKNEYVNNLTIEVTTR
jgi:hypothetical protein